METKATILKILYTTFFTYMMKQQAVQFKTQTDNELRYLL